jgi:hypothetical protein
LNKGFKTQTISGPLSMKLQGELEFEAVPEGTRLRMSHRIILPWWLRPLQPIVAWQVRRDTERAVATLKELLETAEGS